MIDHPSRRDFLKTGAITGLGAALGGAAPRAFAGAGEPKGAGRTQFRVAPVDPVRVGFVGVGGMGSAHVQNYLNIDGVEIKAVCDIVPAKVERVQKWCTDAGQPKPTGYSNGPWDFKRMCETERPRPGHDRHPLGVARPGLRRGHEERQARRDRGPGGHDPRRLLEARRDGREDRQALPDDGELLLRPDRADDPEPRPARGAGRDPARRGRLPPRPPRGQVLQGRRGAVAAGMWSQKLNGNLYPTHGLGPVAQCMNVNRGDAFDYLVSMSTPARGLHEYAVEKFGPDSPQAKEKYVLGDVNTSLIKTKLGKTIILIHDTNLPRPYTRINLVQGTKGIAHKWPDRIYVEGKAAKPHEWDDFEKFAAEYEHPLWKAIAQRGEGRGHGGMDYIEDYRLIWTLRKGEPLDQDVYDAAAWSAIVEASCRSVAGKGRPVEIPDFTRGAWKTNPPLGIVTA